MKFQLSQAHTKFIAILLTLLSFVALAVNDYSLLKSKFEKELLPNISKMLNQLAEATQDQLEFIQFNTVKSYSPYVNSESFDLDACLYNIKYNIKTNSFGATPLGDSAHISSKDGVLIGRGDFQQFSAKEKNRLCYIVTSANSNSELIRLAKNDATLNSEYYFISRFSDYTFLYDSYYSTNIINTFQPSFIRDDFKRANERNAQFWVSLTHKSAYKDKNIISFVKNITNEYNNVVGFLVRSFSIKDLNDLAYKSIWQSSIEQSLLSRGQLFVKNKDVIYQGDKSDLNTSQYDDLIFEQAQSSNTFVSSAFGGFDTSFRIPLVNLPFILISQNKDLLYVPFILFFVFYYLIRQLVNSLHESDRQHYDGMTKVYNRKGFQKKVKLKIKKQVGLNKTAHIMALDANQFKMINDKYGHEMGDQAIKVIAQSALAISREEDDVIRLGGDEFLLVVYVPTNIEFSPDEFLYSLNRKISYECKAKSVPLFTVTIGHVAYTLETSMTLDSVLKQADKILLEKKWLEKVERIHQGSDPYQIKLTQAELAIKGKIALQMNYIQSEEGLQKVLNDSILSAYRTKLNYMMSNYFRLIFSTRVCDEAELHNFRMNLVETHHLHDVSMSVFYLLFIKYMNLMTAEIFLTEEEECVLNRIVAHEMYYISSLRLR